jgi:hypothetical protein
MQFAHFACMCLGVPTFSNTLPRHACLANGFTAGCVDVALSITSIDLVAGATTVGEAMSNAQPEVVFTISGQWTPQNYTLAINNNFKLSPATGSVGSYQLRQSLRYIYASMLLSASFPRSLLPPGPLSLEPGAGSAPVPPWTDFKLNDTVVGEIQG